MKKILFLFGIALALIGCEFYEGTTLKTIPVRVDAREWQFGDGYYFCRI